MLFDFRNKLRQLNDRLRIVATGSPYFAGIEYKGKEEDGSICGISKLGLTRDQSIIDKKGHLKIRSCRAVLFILMSKKLINRGKAEKLFSMRLDKKHPPIREE